VIVRGFKIGESCRFSENLPYVTIALQSALLSVTNAQLLDDRLHSDQNGSVSHHTDSGGPISKGVTDVSYSRFGTNSETPKW